MFFLMDSTSLEIDTVEVKTSLLVTEHNLLPRKVNNALDLQ